MSSGDYVINIDGDGEYYAICVEGKINDTVLEVAIPNGQAGKTRAKLTHEQVRALIGALKGGLELAGEESDE